LLWKVLYVVFYHVHYIFPSFSLFHCYFPPIFCLHIKLFDILIFTRTSPKWIRPFNWYKCRCFTLCSVSVDLTLKLSRLNKGYQTSALAVISTLCKYPVWRRERTCDFWIPLFSDFVDIESVVAQLPRSWGQC
jgi:hypothetical protein